MSKAVIFDLDDTLYDERQYVFSGFRAVAVHLCSQYNLDGEAAFRRMQQLLEEVGRGKIFNVVLEENGIAEHLVPELVRIYQKHMPSLSLYPDAKEVLARLKGKAGLGLITDGASEVQWNKIRALRLEPIMDIIVVTDDYGTENWKPSPFPYELVMEKLAVKGRDCIYIGDNPEKDFITAKKLGWRTVRICRSGGMFCNIRKTPDFEAQREITDLKDLLPLVMGEN